MLNVPIRVGDPGARRLVLVHGFTQSGDVWHDLADRLASEGFEVLCPDLPGHGGTDARYDLVDLWEAGRLLGETCGSADYVGYSLGGRTLLHTALHTEGADWVRSMVLVGAKAGFRDPEAAKARTLADEQLADRIEALGRQGLLHEFIDEWLQHPVNIRLPEAAKHRDLRLRNRAEGLASSLRACGSGPQRPLWELLPSLTMPVLVAFAEHDTPVILEDNAGIAAGIGSNAQQVRVPGVGHSIPFEAPEEFAAMVLEFLRANP